MNTTENNKLIADFMDWEKESWPYNSAVAYFTPFSENSLFAEDLKFNSSWDWLMPVVEKIEKKHEFNTKLWYNRTRKEYQMQLFYTDFEKDIIVNSKVKIEAVYNACVEFIKWYNEQK